jgi:tetratricopeptide (TPR) repeat protein
MVIFVTAAAADLTRNGVEHTTSNIVSIMPRFEVCARNKSATRELSDPRKKARFHHIALRAVPEDGESWGYLGLSTLEIEAADSAIHCLERAVELKPYDGRFFNNLGIALKQKLEKQVEDGNITCMVQKNDADSRIHSCFEHAVTLLVETTSKGYDVGTNIGAAALNLGLWFANRDLFCEACEALSFVRGADVSYDTILPK